MKIVWKDSNTLYIQGFSAYLGKWLVGNVFYDGISSEKEVGNRRYKGDRFTDIKGPTVQSSACIQETM